MEVFGRINVEVPKFEVLRRTAAYELRRYGPTVHAVAPSDGLASGSGFGAIAAYIFGRAQAESVPRPIAMTAPVITYSGSGDDSKDAHDASNAPETKETKETNTNTTTSNDHSNTSYMAFVMPAEYSSPEQLPKPQNPSLRLLARPAETLAVRAFSGLCVESGFRVMRYNPPWTLPFLRTNEVAFVVNE